STSGRLTPDALTRINTSPTPGCGSACCTSCSTSGPPGWLMAMALTAVSGRSRVVLIVRRLLLLLFLRGRLVGLDALLRLAPTAGLALLARLTRFASLARLPARLFHAFRPVEQGLHRQLDAAPLVGLEHLDLDDLTFAEEIGALPYA